MLQKYAIIKDLKGAKHPENCKTYITFFKLINGHKKTGWFSYHPQEIEVSLSGQIRRAAIPTLSTQKPQTSMS